MPSKLEQVLADLEADIVAAVAGTTFLFGHRRLPDIGAPPRIVWTRAEDAFGAPAPSAKSPPAVATCQARVEAHCWGGDDEKTEALRDAVVLALRKKAGVNLGAVTAKWVPSALLADGEVCVVAFAVAQPVTKAAPGTVVITSVGSDPTGAVAGDGTLQCGEG